LKYNLNHSYYYQQTIEAPVVAIFVTYIGLVIFDFATFFSQEIKINANSRSSGTLKVKEMIRIKNFQIGWILSGQDYLSELEFTYFNKYLNKTRGVLC
jgi:hypothetical protein